MAAQLCQQHCPVAHVAAEFPQLCEAETEAIGRVLGRHVQRLATIAHGDGVCTTSIPHTPTTLNTDNREESSCTPNRALTNSTHSSRASDTTSSPGPTRPPQEPMNSEGSTKGKGR